MAQAGMHALLGVAVRRITPRREWLFLGMILGSFLPDLDNFAVAIATLTKSDTHALHRTFTHSVFAIAVAVLAFYGIFMLRKEARWLNLGLGLGIGMGLHIALDILLWFSGVQLLWPFGGWLNLWANYRPAEWFSRLMEPAEFLFFGLYAFWLAVIARKFDADPRQLARLRIWGMSLLLLFAVFTPLAYGMQKGFPTLYGLVYLVTLGWAFSLTIQMRQAIEAAG